MNEFASSTHSGICDSDLRPVQTQFLLTERGFYPIKKVDLADERPETISAF